MNEYEAKLEAKRERLEARAGKLQRLAEGADRAAHRIADNIPLGQPILVGHHSEKRARRDQERIRRGFTKAAELRDQAAELGRRADAVGSGGISGDDPEAAVKLTLKLQELTARRDRMKAINAHFRKTGRYDEPNMTKAEEAEVIGNVAVWKDAYKRVPFPPYCLSNLGANIRRVEERIKEETKRSEHRDDAPTEEKIGGATLTVDPGENRVCLAFEKRLSKEHYKKVRQYGFVWSPTRNAFVRKNNPGAAHWGRTVAQEIAADLEKGTQ